jgi:hypothetical protein
MSKKECRFDLSKISSRRLEALLSMFSQIDDTNPLNMSMGIKGFVGRKEDLDIPANDPAYKELKKFMKAQALEEVAMLKSALLDLEQEIRGV